MSRTLPRAAGVKPANCVSRMTRVAGLADTETFPRLSEMHSSAAEREVKAASGGNLCENIANKTTSVLYAVVARRGFAYKSEENSMRRRLRPGAWALELRSLP